MVKGRNGDQIGMRIMAKDCYFNSSNYKYSFYDCIYVYILNQAYVCLGSTFLESGSDEQQECLKISRYSSNDWICDITERKNWKCLHLIQNHFNLHLHHYHEWIQNQFTDDEIGKKQT